MNQSTNIDEMANLLWQIRHLEVPIQRCMHDKEDPLMGSMMEVQFRHKQRVLIEKLLVELANY